MAQQQEFTVWGFSRGKEAFWTAFFPFSFLFFFTLVVLEATMFSLSVKYMSETFGSFNKASSPQSLPEGIDHSQVVGYCEYIIFLLPELS